MVDEKRARRLALSLIALIGIFYSVTLREGHEWGDDFAVYIRRAKNIVEGIPYREAGYLHYPFYPYASYPSYVQHAPPPVFPLLLSPIYKCFGLNLTAMKLEIVLMFLVFLWVVFLAFRHVVIPSRALTLIVLLGASPYVWNFKDQILADLPFLLFLYASLSLLEMTYRPSAESIPRWRPVELGVLLALTYGIRHIGAVLILCLVGDHLLTRRRTVRFLLLTLTVTAVVIFFQHVLWRSDEIYFNPFRVGPEIIARHLAEYAQALSLFWENGYSVLLTWAVTILIASLAVVGYVVRMRQRVTGWELFVSLYVVGGFLLPHPAISRYLLPIIPLLLVYALLGLEAIVASTATVHRVVYVALVTILVGSYVATYTTVEFGPLRDGVGTPDAQAMFAYVKTHTTSSDVCVFRKHRALALFTDRRVSTYRGGQVNAGLWDFFHTIHATVVIVGLHESQDLPEQVVLQRFVSHAPDSFQLVYRNPGFLIYRIIGLPRRRDVS